MGLPFRQAVISITFILALFGVVIAGFFLYRKYQEYRQRAECVISIGRDGKFTVDGKYMDKKEIESYFRKRVGTVKYREGFVKGLELEKAIVYPGCSGVSGVYVRVPEQPFPVRVSINPEADCRHLQKTVYLSLLHECGLAVKNRD